MARHNAGKGSSSVTAKELTRALPKLGFDFIRTVGGGAELWQFGDVTVRVPRAGSTSVARVTLRQIGRACGMSAAEVERAC